MLSIFRNLQKYSVSPPTLKPSHCLGSYIYLPYIPAFQGYTFLTYLPVRDIHSFKLHDCLSGIYLSYIPAFQGYNFLIYQPFRDIPFLHTSLSKYTFLTYLPFRAIYTFHTCQGFKCSLLHYHLSRAMSSEECTLSLKNV